MRWLMFLGAVAGWVSAQEALDPQMLLLSKIRHRALENLQHQPNYTCVETVERSHRAPATKKFQLIDTLRLEVGLVDGKEMFGWPGSKKFEETDLRNIVTEGAIGNGDFALHLRALFEGQSAMFSYRGQELLDGRNAERFNYRVPLMMSGYTLKVREAKAVVGYHGAVYADPGTLDIRRIEVIGDDIPLKLDLSAAADRVDYARVAIGDGDFLLPEASELKLTDLNGGENLNRIRFASCRQFAGESVLTFGDAPALGPAAAPLAVVELPAKMSVVLSLMDDLNLRTAAVGDPVKARLQGDLKQNGHLLFPKGATAGGRISMLELRSDYIKLGIEFSEMESAVARARLNLKLDEVGGQKLFQADPARFRAPEAHPGEGVLLLRPDRFVLQHGILMFWRTS